MKKYSFNQISLVQYIFIISETQIGIGVLSLPSDLAKSAGTDGWLSILLGWLLCILASLFVIRIMDKNPGYTLIEILSANFGKWMGRGLSVLWIMYTAFAASVAMFSTIFIIKLWIIPDMWDFILMILFLVPIYMVTKQGVRIIGVSAELIFLVSIWMPFFLFFTLKDFHWLFLLPIAKEGLLPILSTVKSTIFSFLGFELAFILYPFLKDKKSASKGIVIANSLSMIIFVFVTVICYIKFSPDEIKDYAYPTLNLLKVIRLPFLERLEITFLSFYLLILFITVIPYLYTTVLGISQLCGKQDHRTVLRIFIGLLILISFFFSPSSSQVARLGILWGQLGTYFAYVFPVCLWIYGWLFQLVRKGQVQ
ncbi:GerAB/ArcD/ProY family transporter [Paenibacillus aceris]|uniref:Spore germination protein (Amino acid permease) n=1 Tax=Paenibacillus aceris TaxID=869555 RepID=A0ABS4HUH4_9BACL|nr:endospore germination permease [Paenibacillus aceris]MBP1962284.1 spore germination protein (amino acid permease) [Paenibacillus aceris]NHW37110.1 endospore germination permease [Paenibacillus aceris]